MVRRIALLFLSICGMVIVLLLAGSEYNSQHGFNVATTTNNTPCQPIIPSNIHDDDAGQSITSPPTTLPTNTRHISASLALMSLCRKIPSALAPFCSDHTRFSFPGSDKRGVVVLLLQTPTATTYELYFSIHNILYQLDHNYPFPVDVMILHENFPAQDMQIVASFTSRTIIWVDVSQHFVPTQEETKIRWEHCAKGTRMGYRKMCQFMASKLYWLPQLDPYEYIIRFDDDSEITSMVKFNLFDVMDKYQLNYAYALDIRDSEDCQKNFMEETQTYLHSQGQQPLRFGPVSFHQGMAWNATYRVFNCNFEVVRLSRMRATDYREYIKFVEASKLIFSTRLGDHAIKTLFLELFEAPSKIACLATFPYGHGHSRFHRKTSCRYYQLKL